MDRRWCHVCRETVDTFVRETANAFVLPAVAAAIGGAAGHGGRRNASLGEVLFGAAVGLATGAVIHAASRKAQDVVCSTCGIPLGMG